MKWSHELIFKTWTRSIIDYCIRLVNLSYENQVYAREKKKKTKETAYYSNHQLAIRGCYVWDQNQVALYCNNHHHRINTKREKKNDQDIYWPNWSNSTSEHFLPPTLIKTIRINVSRWRIKMTSLLSAKPILSVDLSQSCFLHKCTSSN